MIKRIYRSIPFKKQIFQALKFLWTPPHSIYKHLYFDGIMKIKVDNESAFLIRHYQTEIENDIFWKGLTGGWEKISMQFWMKLAKQAKVILDIGANTGIYALAAKSLNREAAVFAFEPLKQMFSKLTANSQLNNYDIVCIEKAVSDKNGKAIIYETGNDHVAAASLNSEIRQYGNLDRETEIEAITLETFIRDNNIKKIDLIKIDVETYEPNVIAGYKQYLSLHRPDVLVEVLNDEVGDKLQPMFDGLDYVYFNIDDKKGTIRKTDTIKKSDYFNYLLCTKESARKLRLI